MSRRPAGNKSANRRTRPHKKLDREPEEVLRNLGTSEQLPSISNGPIDGIEDDDDEEESHEEVDGAP